MNVVYTNPETRRTVVHMHIQYNNHIFGNMTMMVLTGNVIISLTTHDMTYHNT